MVGGGLKSRVRDDLPLAGESVLSVDKYRNPTLFDIEGKFFLDFRKNIAIFVPIGK